MIYRQNYKIPVKSALSGIHQNQYNEEKEAQAQEYSGMYFSRTYFPIQSRQPAQSPGSNKIENSTKFNNDIPPRTELILSPKSAKNPV